MRNGARGRNRQRPDDLTDGLIDWLDAGGEPVDRWLRRRPRRSQNAEPAASVRLTLIDFLWTGPAGAQPVILVSREWLQ